MRDVDIMKEMLKTECDFISFAVPAIGLLSALDKTDVEDLEVLAYKDLLEEASANHYEKMMNRVINRRENLGVK